MQSELGAYLSTPSCQPAAAALLGSAGAPEESSARLTPAFAPETEARKAVRTPTSAIARTVLARRIGPLKSSRTSRPPLPRIRRDHSKPKEGRLSSAGAPSRPQPGRGATRTRE